MVSEAQSNLYLDAAVAGGGTAAGPKPKLPDVENDSPNRGELKLPIGFDRLVLFSRF